MGTHVIKMPDIGEGIAEVELVAWHVKPGDTVKEDQVLADVMTDKATVEIPSPVSGKVVSLGGTVGEQMAVGAELIRLEVEGAGNVKDDAPPAAPKKAVAAAPSPAPREPSAAAPVAAPVAAAEATRPALPPRTQAATDPRARRQAHRLAGRAPPCLGPRHRTAVRARQRPGRPHHARGPRRLPGIAGPAGAAQPAAAPTPQRHDEEAVAVIGLRRKIAQKMQESKRRIPHFTYVEEIDVTELEALRAQLNAKYAASSAAS